MSYIGIFSRWIKNPECLLRFSVKYSYRLKNHHPTHFPCCSLTASLLSQCTWKMREILPNLCVEKLGWFFSCFCTNRSHFLAHRIFHLVSIDIFPTAYHCIFHCDDQNSHCFVCLLFGWYLSAKLNNPKKEKSSSFFSRLENFISYAFLSFFFMRFRFYYSFFLFLASIKFPFSSVMIAR